MSKQVIGGLLIAASLVAVNWDSVKTYLPDSQPAVVQEETISESQVWLSLQKWCEKGQIRDSDELQRVANSLVTMGLLSDVTRLDKYDAKNVPLTPEIIQGITTP